MVAKNITGKIGSTKFIAKKALLLTAGILIAVGISILGYIYQKQLADAQALKVKKQSLLSFASKIAMDIKDQDWQALYSIEASENFKNLVSEDEYIAAMSRARSNIYSEEVNIAKSGLKVNGNSGNVKESITICITQDCTGKNYQSSSITVPFVYDKGEWKLFDPGIKPSPNSLNLSAELYTSAPSSARQEFINYFGGGWNSESFAIANLALLFDHSSTALAEAKNALSKVKIVTISSATLDLIECDLNKAVAYTQNQQDCSSLQEMVRANNPPRETQTNLPPYLVKCDVDNIVAYTDVLQNCNLLQEAIKITANLEQKTQSTNQPVEGYIPSQQPVVPYIPPVQSYHVQTPQFHYTTTYSPPPIYLQPLPIQYSNASFEALDSIRQLENNLQNIVNNSFQEMNQIQTNYQLQELNNALRY